MPLWIRLEDKNRATKFPIVDGNMSHDMDDLATELCKKGRLRTLKIDPADLEFFGDYDRSHYDDGDGDGDGDGSGDDDDNEPLRSDIQLQHLKTTAVSPLVVRYPLSDYESKIFPVLAMYLPSFSVVEFISFRLRKICADFRSSLQSLSTSNL